MNQMTPERRRRARTRIGGNIELVAGDARVFAELLDLSFVGLRCRVASGAMDMLTGPVDYIRLEDLPSLAVRVRRIEHDEFAATFVDPDRAGPVVAGFFEIFTPQYG